MKSLRITVLALLAVYPALRAGAMDVGDPLYAPDLEGRPRLEFLYENFDREAEFDDLTLEVVGPGGAVSASADVDEEVEADQDLYILRFTPLAAERGAVFLDAGLVDHDEGDDLGYTIGAGGRVLAVQSGKLRISLVGAFHYVPSFDLEDEDIETELSYWEASGGVLASGVIDVDAKTVFVPYGGLVLAMLDGEVESEADLGGAVARGDAEFEEEDLPVLVVGGTLVFNRKVSVRAEGRLIGDESFSLGIGSAL